MKKTTYKTSRVLSGEAPGLHRRNQTVYKNLGEIDCRCRQKPLENQKNRPSQHPTTRRIPDEPQCSRYIGQLNNDVMESADEATMIFKNVQLQWRKFSLIEDHVLTTQMLDY